MADRHNMPSMRKLGLQIREADIISGFIPLYKRDKASVRVTMIRNFQYAYLLSNLTFCRERISKTINEVCPLIVKSYQIDES